MNEVENKPYTVHKNPLPIDMLSEGPGGDCWYRVPSWRVEFSCDALKGVDVRAHRGLGGDGPWTLSEASTGFKMFGEMPEDRGSMEGMLAEFAAGVMLKVTHEKVTDSIARAKAILSKRLENPFVVTEVVATTDEMIELAGALERELARKTIKDVEEVALTGTWQEFYRGGMMMSCEEIMYRLQLAWGEVPKRGEPQHYEGKK